ncbi:MAG: VWA-like domain-containing protein [Sulfurimonas sp.]|nr:VWA-like domain-containing protein [Sulfurimonas sp.]
MATISSEFLLRLEKIRIAFLFDHPFLSVLALSIKMEFRKNPHEAFETNGTHIFVDSLLCEHIPDNELKYIYAHTLLHILLKHPFRMHKRDKAFWNRSSDIVINLLLSDFERIGERPKHEVMLEKFRDKSVEEVYNILYEESSEGEGEEDDENPNEEKLDLIESEGDTNAVMEEMDALIVQAMGAALKQGNIPASFLEMIQEVIRPKIDLETLLHSYMSESFFDKESSFAHPNRRFIHQGLYLPGYKHERSRLKLIIALDRSMSISNNTFSKFLGIIDGVLRMGADFEVTVIPFDEHVDTKKIVRYNSQDIRQAIAFEKGNGGTLIEPLFEYIKTQGEMDSTLIVLSDGLFRIEKTPEINTLFLVSQKKNMQRLERFGDVFYFDL